MNLNSLWVLQRSMCYGSVLSAKLEKRIRLENRGVFLTDFIGYLSGHQTTERQIDNQHLRNVFMIK